MTKFVALVVFWMGIAALVNADSKVCIREPGDQLIYSQPIVHIGLLGDAGIQKVFPGYRITCVEANLPLGLGYLLNLNIVNGGVGCDSVALKIRVGRLLSIEVGVNVYAVKVSPGKENELQCS